MSPRVQPIRPIRYVTTACRLGHVLLAAGERGICALRLGDDARELVRRFRAAHPYAEAAPQGDPALDHCASIVRFIDDWDGRGAPPELPLELRGTPFQRRVWASLQRIPAGEVRSYGEVARAIGLPGGARAVASACARNPVAVLVPCHRVVPKSGGYGGYRWGEARKRALLEREAAAKRAAGEGGEPAESDAAQSSG